MPEELYKYIWYFSVFLEKMIEVIMNRLDHLPEARFKGFEAGLLGPMARR